MAFVDLLHITIVSEGRQHVESTMPITPDLYQPFGFLHGGATIALLESTASVGAQAHADLSRERPFGIEVQVRHRKSATTGLLHATADLEHVEGSKQFWSVCAVDDEGDVISEGTIVVKVVSLARLAQKERERAAARKSAS